MTRPVSEWLRMLDEAMPTPPMDEDWLLPADDETRALAALRNALPALVALVEAALERHYEQEPSHRDVPPNWCPVCSAEAALSTALPDVEVEA